ncbi:MAG TPA: hypothetical protein VL326_09900 [Kofleriaceae bacterium]|jgi:hypothetical protein|nr:hypothetical protein [Kofleriaceae bacterium]
MDRTPLDTSKLSPAIQKALGPGPAKMMAARGMAPLPPADQLTVLYQLSLDADAKIADSAKQTAAGLPDSILAGAFGNQALDPRVLDFFGPIVAEKPAAFDAFIQSPALADETVAALAGKVGSREVDRIATNEQRLLRHPQIIGSMYLNKHARMSTVDRVVELAVRNNVRVPGLHAWDEIARSLQGGSASTTQDDALFSVAADAIESDDSLLTVGDAEKALDYDEARDKAALEQMKDIPIGNLSVPAKVRLATLGNAFQRAVLVRDPVRIVAMAAIKSPGVTEFEAASYAGNQALPEDVIRHVAGKREWTKLYGTKYALCRNPKTPVTDAMRLMPFLREKDLEKLIRSKGVPSAVVAQARKLMMQRRGGSDKK